MNDAMTEKPDLRCAGAGPPGYADPGVAAPFLDACASIEFLDNTGFTDSEICRANDIDVTLRPCEGNRGSAMAQ
jgi:hypothetical protein